MFIQVCSSLPGSGDQVTGSYRYTTHISLINTTMSCLSAISHKDVLSRLAHSSLRTPHNTGCGCNNAILCNLSKLSLSHDLN